MLRAGIVGLGSWGRTLVASVQRKSEAIRFTHAHTRSPDKAADFCAQHELRMAASFEMLIRERDVDAIVLATPNSQHVEQIERAAGAGKHVFVEKPIALDARGAQRAIDAATAAGVVLAVGYNRRFHPSMRELRTRARRGDFGAVGSIVAELTATTAFYRAADSWRVDPREEPAGAMTGIGVHLVDGMIDVLGMRVVEVYCTSRQRASVHGEDTTSLMLSFESGVTGLAFCSLAAARNFRFALYGAKGFAEVVTPTMARFRFIPAVEGRASHLASIPDAEEIVSQGINTTVLELEAFARSITERQPYPVPLDEVLHGMHVFDAAVESARSGRPVAVSG
jgi:predicted dehydrogenase